MINLFKLYNRPIQDSILIVNTSYSFLHIKKSYDFSKLKILFNFYTESQIEN